MVTKGGQGDGDVTQGLRCSSSVRDSVRDSEQKSKAKYKV